MKNLILYTLIGCFSLPQLVRAEDMALPVISKPAVLEEGTQRTLTAEQISELLPWAKDSKIFLIDLIGNIQSLSTADKIDKLVEGIKTVVGESAPKNSELFMRYVLNRGLVLNDMMTAESSDLVVGTLDAKLRILRSSIELAIRYYEKDMERMTKKSTPSFVLFGLEYFEFLSELNKSIFDASAQYSIQRTSLEWLQWDLYRDLKNASFASQIVKINNSLKTFSNKKLSDTQAIASIRQLKLISEQVRQMFIGVEGLSGVIVKRSQSAEGEGDASKGFETLMLKKSLTKNIAEASSYAQAAMRYVTTKEEFFKAINPDVPNPAKEYISALGQVAVDNIHVLIRLSGSAKDIMEINSMLNDVYKIMTLTEQFLPQINSSEEFLTLFDYTTNTPSDLYKSQLRKLALANMQIFTNFNPSKGEKDILLARFN